MNLDLKKNLDYYLGIPLLFILRPFVRFLGIILKRNHDPKPNGTISILKLQGGGSLIIAYNALLGIKKTYPHLMLQLITTKGIAPFGKTLNIFDRILIIDDSSLFKLLKSSLKTMSALFKTDTILDYEVHSRLSTIFTLLTCSRNRMGFYRDDVRERTFFNTHLVFFNLYNGSYHFYEELNKVMSARISTPLEAQEYFINRLSLKNKSPEEDYSIAIGHGCSDLALERQLTPGQWKIHFSKNLDKKIKAKIHFIGGPKEKNLADEIIKELSPLSESWVFFNHCGKFTLEQSIQTIFACDEFWGIDSAPLHFARLIGKKVTAYFGPTAPQSLLRPLPHIEEKIIYKVIPCSPCVHVTETPPCKGNNICISQHF